MYGYASTSEILGWILGNWLHLDNLLKVRGRFTKWGKITCDHNPPLAFIGILWGIYKSFLNTEAVSSFYDAFVYTPSMFLVTCTLCTFVVLLANFAVEAAVQ